MSENTEVQRIEEETANSAETVAAETATAAVVLAESEPILSVKKGKQLLHKLETTISKGIREFWVVGESLAEIRDQKLYIKRYSGEDYSSFGDYISNRWGYSRGYQLVTAARIRRTMIEVGIRSPDSICTSERQYRAHSDLLKLATDPEKLENLKRVVGKQKKLSNESLAAEIRKLLPETKLKKEKPAIFAKSLDKKLAKLRKGLDVELKALRAQHPEQLEVIAAWVQGLVNL